MPSSWPSSRILLARAGFSETRAPTAKNVALARCRLSTSSRRGVQTGSGPSSKVRATVLAGRRRLRGPWPVALTRGPPRRTRSASGEEPASAAGATAVSPTSLVA
ncbi:hypothetical protein [Nonomuraea pusilla]|uniref:hypothetical protein n=1 Tax=Nonomuraea pusilla TaxID=46177 RepID=UPI003D9DC7C5